MRTNFLFSLFAWLLCSKLCSAGDTLNIDEKITNDSDKGNLVSAEKKFELGFFSPSETGGNYLGIWYIDFKPQTVVWVANRNKPVVDSKGVFKIADDGNIAVMDIYGHTYWSSKLEGSSSRNRTVKLMDSGNLVLLDGDLGMSYLWQSFQHPTDTFLPGMKMDRNLQLTSWRGINDPGNGRFTFKMANSGYIIVHDQSQTHWKSDGRLGSEAELPEIVYLLANSTSNNSSYTFFNKTNKFEPNPFDNNQTSRVVMNSSGEIQYLKWDVSQSQPQWVKEWHEPANKCNIYNYCGNFSSCNINNERPCKCLPGFSQRLPGNQLKSSRGGLECVRKSTSTSCADKDMTFLNLTRIKVSNPPDMKVTTTTEAEVAATTEAECQSFCLGMCPQCRAYSYNASTYNDRSPFSCRIWTQDLLSLQEEYDGGGDLSVLVKSSDIASTGKSCKPCGAYIVPYPLSTEPNCGDPMYKLKCDDTTGEVGFEVRGRQYRVTYINEVDREFLIRTDDSSPCDPNYQNVKPDFPFNVSCTEYGEDEIEVSWLPPREPPCNKSIDCIDWPHSTCSATSEGKSRCLCDSNYRWNDLNLSCTQEPSRSHGSKRLPLILSLALTGMIFMACTIIFAYVWRQKIAHKLDKASMQIQESLYDSERRVKDLIGLGGLEENDSESIGVPFYSFGSILAATDNFSDSNKLGRGGFGPVYKGRFPGGQDIAIKRLSSVSTQGLQEFKNEVVLIAKLQHRNLVRLRGYCIKGEEKILLYEYMPNKSLDLFIFDRTRTLLLDWQLRFDIILGVARGLLYLHQDSRLRVIHRDLKTSNILLDEEMNPKISDFGLAKIFGGKETEASTERVVGTYGYMAPEYALDGLFSIKSDVFSFGVVLLEILSGKKNTGFYQSKQIASLLGYAWRLWTENKLLDLMDSSISETCNENQFIKCALIGLLCVQDEPGDRPTMSNVVSMLDSEITTVPTPTQPTFFTSRNLSSTASSSSSKPETSLQIDSSYQEGR